MSQNKTPLKKKDFDLNPITAFNKVQYSFFTQFGEFLKEYGVIALAIGLVIGEATTSFIKSFLINIVNPIVSDGILKDFVKAEFGSVKIGQMISDLIQFIIILLIVFLVVRYVLKFFKFVDQKKENEEQKTQN